MKNFIFLFSFVFSILVSFTAFSQPEYQSEQQQFTDAELAQMLAPIALYPDSLLTHILISSTYPIEIIEAHRWLKKNEKLSAEQIAHVIKNFEWDASVKALVPFERVLTRLSENLTWMQQLGDAFLQDESSVLESIQALREQAKLAGNLDKMENMDVSYEDNNIIIEPVEKEIVYVPYYDTRMVYGNWYWSSYPPVYWTPYHRTYVSHYNPFYWHSGIHISFNYFFSAFHWHNRHVVVVNSHRSHHRYYHQRPRRLIASGGYAKRWSHKPVHRRGVAYRTKHAGQKYYSSHTKKQKVNQGRKSSHYAQRDFKQRLSLNNHFSNKRKANKEPAKHNKSLRGTPKQYSASVKYKEPRQKKWVSQRSNVKNIAPKRYKENSNKQYTSKHRTGKDYATTKGRSNNNSSRKQHQQIALTKTHRNANRTKLRH